MDYIFLSYDRCIIMMQLTIIYIPFYFILPSILNHYLLSMCTHNTEKLFLLLNLWSIKIIPLLLFGYNTEYNDKDLNVSCELEFPLSISNPLYILLLQNLSRRWCINQKNSNLLRHRYVTLKERVFSKASPTTSC